MRWTNGQLEVATVHAGKHVPNTISVVYDGKKRDLNLASGQAATVSLKDFR
jgi:hypothetical protein